MAWIESHQQLREHPKVMDLGAAMGWDLDQTLGKLHRFWWWCQDYAEDGDLRRHSDVRIAVAMGLSPGNAQALVQAMRKAKWIDAKPYRRVHDWWDYIGPWLQAKYKRSPEKWQQVRHLYGKGDVTVTGGVTQPDTLPNLTNQEIKDGSPVLRTFMQHLTQTLHTKTGHPPDPKIVRKAYGRVVWYLKTYPDEQPALNEALDRCPPQRPSAWYVAFLTGQIEHRLAQHLKGLTATIGS